MRQHPVRRYLLGLPYEFSQRCGQRATRLLNGFRFYTEEWAILRIEEIIQTLEWGSLIGRRVSSSLRYFFARILPRTPVHASG